MYATDGKTTAMLKAPPMHGHKNQIPQLKMHYI